ncbi:MAG: hypothetical protein ACOVRN_02385 [Flavobacterium sp.]
MEQSIEKIAGILLEEGIQQNIQYSITAYSLNTKLSFKFENAADLLALLKQADTTFKPDEAVIEKTIIDAGLNPEQFFYVNFYKEKVTEL